MIEKVINWLEGQVGNIAKDYCFSTDWCALFVDYMCKTFDNRIFSGASVYSCTAQMKYFKEKGLWADGIPTLNEPCLIYYDWDLSGDCDHVGIMLEKTNNAFVTIEGNTMGDKWNNTSVNKMTRTLYNNARLVRGHVYLRSIFKCGDNLHPSYYGINYTTKDNTGKCQLLQHMLNVVDNAGVTEDGIIGRNTDISIKKFQAKHKLEVDGIVGDETLFKLVQLYFNIPLENFKIGT